MRVAFVAKVEKELYPRTVDVTVEQIIEQITKAHEMASEYLDELLDDMDEDELKSPADVAAAEKAKRDKDKLAAKKEKEELERKQQEAKSKLYHEDDLRAVPIDDLAIAPSAAAIYKKEGWETAGDILDFVEAKPLQELPGIADALANNTMHAIYDMATGEARESITVLKHYADSLVEA